MSVNVNGTAYNVTFGAVGSAPAAAPAASAAPAVTGGEDVNAPVAGTLLRYAVDNGASVSKGQTVIVLESMKMELEVKAPCNGTITFTAQTGSQVSNGQKLAVIGGTAAVGVEQNLRRTDERADLVRPALGVVDDGLERLRVEADVAPGVATFSSQRSAIRLCPAGVGWTPSQIQ